MQLVEYIDQLAALWSAATGRTSVALGASVVNDGKFMARVRGGTKPTTETFEKFLAFFRDGANWPDNVIPLAAADLLERLENIAVEGGSDLPSANAGVSGCAPDKRVEVIGA